MKETVSAGECDGRVRVEEPQTYFIASPWNNRPVSQHFQALAVELAARGHRVVLLVPNSARSAYSPSTNPAVLNWPSMRPRNLKDAVFLFRLVRKHKPDCLIANFGAANVMTLVGSLMRVKARVNWYHTLSSQLLVDNPVSKLRHHFLVKRKALIHRLATHVVPVSNAASDDIQRVFHVPERKCKVFLNSMADPLRTGALDKPPASRLICIGRLFPSKGQDVVIRAISILRKALPNLRVDFVGSGPSKASLLRLAKDCKVSDMVSFQDSAIHNEVLERMSSSIATLVPSRSDNCPLVTIESLSVGTPVIASAVGGIVEIVRHGVDGFLVPPDNPEQLAERISSLFANPSLRESMSASARERFLSTFERQNIIHAQVRWFETIAGSANGYHQN